ncbi:MAG: cytochrome c biogenesis protein CcdA, partial [Planctomycetes bacterium]|nr:cytochrome c biogenesis protein CcdA [Planctomycetota bacterium]
MMGQSLGVLVSFTAGLFSFLSPCVLPLFPSYLSFITGMSVNALTHEVTTETRRRIVLHSLTF